MQFLFASVLFYAAALVHAVPLMQRIVVAPPITSPVASTVWTPGSDELVTWDASTVPAEGNFTGQLVLGFQTEDSENLDLAHPLAEGFSLRDGAVHVTCPDVPTRDNYIVVLIGDSGNASPQFTIANGADNDARAAPQVATSTVSSPAGSLTGGPTPIGPLSSSQFLPNPRPSSTPLTSDSGSSTSTSSGSSSSTPTSSSPPSSTSGTSSSESGSTSGSSSSTSFSSSSSDSAPTSVPSNTGSSNGALPRTVNGAVLSACAGATMVAMFFF
ncbi:hypothetical protein BC834DRAFT_931847 [Gloeopeniophorella convolvens]|nr:hypothetical protein BC834DRAFT_931847 [Gloeopeniophorella convolvens]